MNIAFDIDGVLYPWHNSVFNHLASSGKIGGESFFDFWVNGWKKFDESYWHYLASLEILYDNFNPYSGVLDTLMDISNRKHNILYITDRYSPQVVRVTERYFQRHSFPQHSNVFFSRDKRSTLSKLEVDIMVEDRYANLKDIAGMCKVLGMARPWNWEFRDEMEGMGVVFINHISGVLDYL